MNLFTNGTLQETWINSQNVQSRLGLSQFVLRTYCREIAGEGDWLEINTLGGERGKEIWISPEMESALSEALFIGQLPNDLWNTAAQLASSCGVQISEIRDIIAEPMTQTILPGHLVDVKFDGEDATLISPAGEKYIRSVLRSRHAPLDQPNPQSPLRTTSSATHAPFPGTLQFRDGIERYRGLFSPGESKTELDVPLLGGNLKNIESTHQDINIQREKGLTFERLTHYALLIAGESAVPQALLKIGPDYIMPDFYSSTSNRLIEAKWGGDGPGIAQALSKGNYYRSSEMTRHRPQQTPGYLLVHHIDNPSLDVFTQHDIEVVQLNSTIVGHDAGPPGLSPEKDAACCLRLLMENVESAMALPGNEALERLGVIKKATETIIAKRLGLDQGREYSTLRSEDFVAACNNKNGAEELKIAQRFLNGDLAETIELPVHGYVYLADQDRLITTPVDIEVMNLVKSTGLLKVKTDLDSLRSGKGNGSLVNVIRAINAVDIQSLATESESLAIAMAAAEGVMRCLSSNLAFDSLPNLRTPDGITTLGDQVRKWQAASDFVRGGAVSNPSLRDELKRFSRTCIRIQSSLGLKGQKLPFERASSIAEDSQLVELINSNQHDYNLLDPYVGGLLRDQGMDIARWALRNCPKHDSGLSVINKLHTISYNAAVRAASYPASGTKNDRVEFTNENLQTYINLQMELIDQAMNIKLDTLKTLKEKEIEILQHHPHGRQLIEYFSQKDTIYTIKPEKNSAEKQFRGAGLPRNLRRDSPRISLDGISWSSFMMATLILNESDPVGLFKPMSLRPSHDIVQNLTPINAPMLPK